MDFSFSSDTLMLQDMLRRFLEKEVRPLESKFFTTKKLDPVERNRLRHHIEQMGLWGATIPADYGGGELDLITSCILEEELGKTFIPLEIGDIPPMLYACREAQVKRFLAPAIDGRRQVFLAGREAESIHPNGWTTSAALQGEEYFLSGAKQLSASPQPEDFFVVFAKTEQGFTAFLLDADRDDIEVRKNDHPCLILRKCKTTKDAILGEVGQAFTLGQKEAPRCWIRIGARYVGLVARLLEMSAIYASDWIALGKPLGERPAVRKMVAEIQVQVECCRWLVYHAAWIADQGQPLQMQSAQVRLATGELLRKAVDFVTLIYGGPGPSIQTEVHRFVTSVLAQEVMNMALDSATATIASQIITSYQRS